jgi:hypothetical protein
LWKWRDEAEIRTAVAREGLNFVQDLVPLALSKLEDSLNSADPLDAAKLIIKMGILEVLKPTRGGRAGALADGQPESLALCPRCHKDHGYDFCEDLTPEERAAALLRIPQASPPKEWIDDDDESGNLTPEERVAELNRILEATPPKEWSEDDNDDQE